MDRFAALPLPLLLLISSATEIISPDDLLLFAKTAGVILAQGLSLQGEVASSLVFSLSASVLLLVPFVAVVLGGERVLPMLQQRKNHPAEPWGIGGGQRELGPGWLFELARHHRACPALSQA